MKHAEIAAILSALTLAAGCGARTDLAEDSSAVTAGTTDTQTHLIDQVCSIVLTQTCSDLHSSADCRALYDRNRSLATARGCTAEYDAELACWAAHGAHCSAIGAVWNDGCQMAETKFDRCASN